MEQLALDFGRCPTTHKCMTDAAKPVHALALGNGQMVAYQVRRSRRNKYIHLSLSSSGRLSVSAPQRVSLREIVAAVEAERAWVAAQLPRLQVWRAERLGSGDPELPRQIELPAVSERWALAYRQTDKPHVRVRQGRDLNLSLSGAIDDVEACHAALRRWLRRHAVAILSPWLARVAAELGLSYRRVSVRAQTQRWGSCNSVGAISLNCKLLFLPPTYVRHVLVHELCHTVELSHSACFWARVECFEPDFLETGRRLNEEAWRLIPLWAGE